MLLDLFHVTLEGEDAAGRFRTIYRVVAPSVEEAEILARSSAALQMIEAITVRNTVRAGPSPETDGADIRRVLGHGEREPLT